MGDEYGHSQLGNNNSYNQDNFINYFQWNLLQETMGGNKIFMLFKEMIKFRNTYKVFNGNDSYDYNNKIEWLDITGKPKDWSNSKTYTHFNSFIAYTCRDDCTNTIFYIAYNMSNDSIDLTLPNYRWKVIIDTSTEFLFINMDVVGSSYLLSDHSVIILSCDNYDEYIEYY